ncbi:Survival motor neuron protein [Pseudolycoriella hygida]|uniref:Survival motor neuron protein n=1 Tax=Pseudolycoriella hygida TaxID=35572 RepID=A0A9Q0MSN9_9DIPT|nr:Survival motor neuron protein [Pseudolycoriella hygida]
MNGTDTHGNVDLSNPDIWDDTLLIKAYDESLKLAKENLAKRKVKSTNKQQSDDSADDDASDSKQCQYKIGDFVRATYEDGLDYEAKVMTIDSDNEKCVVRFVGYENEETVKLAGLMSSWGKKARKKQMRAAARDQDGKTDGKRSVPTNVSNSAIPIPFLPPIPPMLNDASEDSENMSAMLMAWYMSGYYTGYYQGRKDSQNKMSMK